MGLGYIIEVVSGAAGLTSLDINPSQRRWLLQKINQAAEEVYESDDLPGCLREAYILVKSNFEVALPGFVGELRAVREANLFKRPIELQDMRPRYHSNPWPNEWNKFIFKGYSPTKTDIVNVAPPKATIPELDATLEITIVGSTVNSNRASETVTMDQVEKNFTTSFTTYESITQNKLGTYNVSIKDSDDTEIAVLYNDRLSSRYALYDVSAYPFGGSCADNQRVAEILYKLPLQQFVNDSDSFIVDGFDNIIILKTLQLITEGEEGKEDRAILINQKTAQLVKKKIQHKIGSTSKILKYPRRKILGMFNWWREY